jgi:hypothetical protein
MLVIHRFLLIFLTSISHKNEAPFYNIFVPHIPLLLRRKELGIIY